MNRFAISAIGRDRPGIVAGVTEALLDFDGNIEDSRMSILGGHFSMTLIVSLGQSEADPPGDGGAALEERLRRELEAVKERLDLEGISVSPVDDLSGTAPRASHILSVYGADHPGIVHSVSAKLTERDISITDLETKLTGGDRPLYVMVIEIAASDADSAELTEALDALAKQAGLEISMRELDDTAL
jgi:glycine cleavage system transcriptional repressor